VKKLWDFAVRMLKKYKSIIMYLIFGVLTTLVNWVVTFICQKVFGLNAQGFQTTLSNGIAWFFAVLFAFVTNRRFVFEGDKDHFFAELVKFYAARIFTGMFETFLPDLLVLLSAKVAFLAFMGKTFLSLEGGIAKLLTSVIVIVLNYVLSKLLVFTSKSKKKAVETEEVSETEKENEE